MLVESLILAKLDYACHNLSSLPPLENVISDE